MTGTGTSSTVTALVPDSDASPETGRAEGSRGLHRLSIAVLLIGLAATAGLSVLSRVNYMRNEQRQVSTQAELASAALAVAPVDIQRRLGRPTTSVAASNNMRLFDLGMKGQVPEPFAGVRLYRMVDGAPHLVHALGDPLELDAGSAAGRGLLDKAATTAKLAVTRLATPKSQRLGYAFAASALGRTYVGYAEQVLPADRRMEISAASPLSDMDFALYFGTKQNAGSLLETNRDRLPITGTVGRIRVALGDQVLTGVITPRSPLLGTFASSVAWVIAAAGLLLTGVMALLTERLQRRRAVAEKLAEVRGRLYRAERNVAETLQTALLPQRMPHLAGLEIATRYRGGTAGIDVGGDWYDVVDLHDGRVFFAIGDVSGRGLSAATTMSRLRHSMTAYAVEGNDPALVLAKVSGLIDLARDGHFATAQCGILDLDTGCLTIANAGHLPLILVEDGATETLAGPLGPPLGVGTDYATAEIRLRPGVAILAYTDGLVERREEPIDDGIARLCRVAVPTPDLETLLDDVLAALIGHRHADDDTAIMGLRWTTATRA